MIKLEDDHLSFTFPEIARPLRAHVERPIGRILPEFLRPEERTALLAELESRRGFRQLDGEAQEPKCPIGGCLPINDSSARIACARSRFIFKSPGPWEYAPRHDSLSTESDQTRFGCAGGRYARVFLS